MGSIDGNGTLSSEKSQGHVVLFPLPASGHYPVFVQLMYKLEAEFPGLIVTIAAGPTLIKDLATRRSRGDFQNIDLRVEEIPGVMPVFAKDPQFPTRAALIAEQNYKETEPLRQKLREQRTSGTGNAPTAIISDYFFFWGKDFADELGIPWYPYFMGSPLWILMMLEHQTLLDAGLDLENAKYSDQFLLEAVPAFAKAPILSAIRVCDIPDEIFEFSKFYSNLAKTSVKAAGLFINAAEELDESGGAVSAIKTLMDPSRVLCIGPSIQLPGFGHVPALEPVDELFPWLKSQREKSVVYVAFGSLGGISNKLVLELAEGLEASGVPFFWALKPGGAEVSAILPKGFEERTAKQGVIATGWVPQTCVLGHPAIGGFLTHCGWSSTLEGFCSGVPLIAWPLYSDQLGTARYVHEVVKVGVMISSFKEKNKHSFDGVTRKEIELAIRKVFLEEEGRQLRLNVEEMQKLGRGAVLEGGSSYNNLRKFLSEVVH